MAVFFLFSCRPLVTTFGDSESAIYYKASNLVTAEFHDTLKVITWNIRFGAARIPWFGDSCGDRVLMTESETINYMLEISTFIDSVKPDILLLQEVDVSSKRSDYINQVQWLLDNTDLNYGAYASMWDAELVPSDGLGKVDVGNAVLSRWSITNAERIQLPLRTDQDALTQYFYLRRNILKVKINLPDSAAVIDKELYAVNIHATAFATDDTKQKHISKYKQVLDELIQPGTIFVSGGDLNSIPTPTVNDSIDFCIEDMCSGESFHTDSNGEPHREGSYFDNFIANDQYPGELNLLQPFYDDITNYFPAIQYQNRNSVEHFTHSPWNTDSESTGFTNVDYWDRKLDYLFTNYKDWSSTGVTHQEAHQLSDHAPVSATLYFNP